MREEELEFIPFWDKLKKSQKEMLCKQTKQIVLSKGDRVLPCNKDYGCFFIRKGGFLALLSGESDTETELFRLRREDIGVLDFGATCGQEMPEIVYKATTNADIYMIEESLFSVLLENNVFFSEYVKKGLLLCIPTLVSAIAQRDHYSLEKRIATVLLSESARQRSSTLLLTHAAIASKIGSAREVVTRKLKEFSDAGFLSHSRGRIVLLNKEKLKRL